MSTISEQLREALTPDEQGNIHLSHEILASIPALLAEHEKLEREAAEYNNFKALIGVYEHERIIEMLRNNKDFPQAASHIMKEQYERQKMLRTQKLEREAEAGKYLVQCLKTMTPWCGVREAEYVEKRIFDYRTACEK